MKEKKNTGRKKKTALFTVLGILIILAAAAAVFFHFGGFGTGKSADPEEFAKFSGEITDLIIPDGARIIALGEAAHGTSEFQQLKLDVFRILVEKYGVRALALEGDFGSCEAVNRYIHGGEGTAGEAAAAIGFTIYRTGEMADLITWMREYNETAAPEEDLRFYGFDMQRCEYALRYLLETAKTLGLDTAELEKLQDGDDIASSFGKDEQAAVYTEIRQKLTEAGSDPSAEFAVRLADVLLQNIELGKLNETGDPDAYGIRDRYMAENVQWILEREEKRGNERIFITGHNGHMKQRGSYDPEHKVMGNLLADEIGSGAYYAIGTDFYKTVNNMPLRSGKRVPRTFYSADPLAKAAKKNGYEVRWLDFSKIPADSVLNEQVNGYIFMGNLGDTPADGLNGILTRILPYAYRVWLSPADLYDGMIFVTNAHPIKVLN